MFLRYPLLFAIKNPLGFVFAITPFGFAYAFDAIILAVSRTITVRFGLISEAEWDDLNRHTMGWPESWREDLDAPHPLDR